MFWRAFFRTPRIFLAPMEGVTDAPMRTFLTETGGFDACVTEFIRVSQEPLSEKVFYKHIPEAAQDYYTPSQTPVFVQLLGGSPERLALTALNAVRSGAKAIDLNFGCPAKTVNRNDGGASLLRYPNRIYSIVQAVRSAVPREIPVSAKLRLGWESISDIHHNADQAAEAGADWITIHARTRMQGYQPPVFWEPIGEVRRRLGDLPVIANGDIWTYADWQLCQEMTGCSHFMLGRSALADPFLSHRIRKQNPKIERELVNHEQWVPLFLRFAQISDPEALTPGYPHKRIKQWVGFIEKRIGPQDWISQIRRSLSLEQALGNNSEFAGPRSPRVV